MATGLVVSLCGLTAIAARAETQRYSPEPMCKTNNPPTGIAAQAREQIADTPRGQISFGTLKYDWYG